MRARLLLKHDGRMAWPKVAGRGAPVLHRKGVDTAWARAKPRAPISDAQCSGPIQMRLDGKLCNERNAEPRRERDDE